VEAVFGWAVKSRRGLVGLEGFLVEVARRVLEKRAGLGFFHYVHEDLHVGGVAGEEAVEFNAYIVHLVGNLCVF